jgi:hypothetical protein
VGCGIMQADRNLPNVLPSPIIMEAANSSDIPKYFTRLHGVTLQKTEIQIFIESKTLKLSLNRDFILAIYILQATAL